MYPNQQLSYSAFGAFDSPESGEVDNLKLRRHKADGLNLAFEVTVKRTYCPKSMSLFKHVFATLTPNRAV